jgi:hypothetical protein
MNTTDETSPAPPPPRSGIQRKSPSQQIEELRKKREQLDARMASLAARQKTEERKRDARRKIIVGAAVLAHAQVDSAFKTALQRALRQAVTRDIDRAAIPDLLGE